MNFLDKAEFRSPAVHELEIRDIENGYLARKRDKNAMNVDKIERKRKLWFNISGILIWLI